MANTDLVAQRDLNCLADDNRQTRKRALTNLSKLAGAGHPPEKLAPLWTETLRAPVLRLFADPVEKNRELAITLAAELLAAMNDGESSGFERLWMPSLIATVAHAPRSCRERIAYPRRARGGRAHWQRRIARRGVGGAAAAAPSAHALPRPSQRPSPRAVPTGSRPHPVCVFRRVRHTAAHSKAIPHTATPYRTQQRPHPRNPFRSRSLGHLRLLLFALLSSARWPPLTF